MKAIILTITALAAFSSAALAHPGHGAKNAAPAKKPSAALVCPVTGTKIASAGKAYDKEAYKGKTYYFCCPECKPRFDRNRDEIVKNAARGKFEKM